MISFTPNCTLPTDNPSGFVNGPNVRSTMDVVWSCASVIILSTWSVLHLNVPPDLRPKSAIQRLRKEFYLWKRKLGWMGIMLAFPEYLTAIAVANLFSARVNHPELETLAQTDNVPWTLTHTILANIGGIAIRFEERGLSDTIEKDSQSMPYPIQSQPPARSGLLRSLTAPVVGIGSDKSRRSTRWSFNASIQEIELESRISRTHPGISKASNLHNPAEAPTFITEFQNSQRDALRGLGDTPWEPFPSHITLALSAQSTVPCAQRNEERLRNDQVAPLHGNLWILDSKQLILARKSNILQRLPSIEKVEIDDRSKTDGLLRVVALTQVLWFGAQLITRRIKGLPSTALEISTVAFAACAFVIYVTEWTKPKDVGVPFYIDCSTAVSANAFVEIAEAAPTTFLQPPRYYMRQSSVHGVVEGRFSKTHVDRLVVLVTILSISLYGGVHLFAWSLDFPTHTEQILWRISALTVGVAPTISALLVLMEDLTSGRTDRWSKWSVTVLAPAYVAARLYIIVESLRSLYFMPMKAFIATNTINMPHIG